MAGTKEGYNYLKQYCHGIVRLFQVTEHESICHNPLESFKAKE